MDTCEEGYQRDKNILTLRCKKTQSYYNMSEIRNESKQIWSYWATAHKIELRPLLARALLTQFIHHEYGSGECTW